MAILTGTARMAAMERSALAYALWLPDDPPPWPAVVIVHGAGSRKENHADFARLATAAGWAALAFDLPGHGDSEPPMSGAAVEDVIAMVRLLASQEGVDPGRVAVRGSSLGGFLAIHATAATSRSRVATWSSWRSDSARPPTSTPRTTCAAEHRNTRAPSSSAALM